MTADSEITPPPADAILQAAETSLVMALAAVDNDGRQSYVSPAFCRMVGWSAGELVGQRAPFFYWPQEELEAIQAAFAQTVAGRAPPDGFELCFNRKSGERFFVQVSISPLVANDERIGWLASLFEITERKQLAAERAERERQNEARQLAEAQRHRLSEILDHMPAGVMIADAATGATIYSNRQAQQIFGGPIPAAQASEEYSTTFSVWTADGRPLESHEFPLVRAVHGETVDGEEVQFRRPTGELVIVRANASPIRDEHGRIVAAVTAYYDVTAQVALEKTIEAERASSLAALKSSEAKYRDAARAMSESEQRFRTLAESERVARKEAELARQRMAMLDAITTDLVGELDDSTAAIERLSRLVVPELADWCVVYGLRDDGTLEPLAVGHADPQRAQQAIELLRQQPMHPNVDWGVPKAVRTGRSELTVDVHDALLAAASNDAQHLERMRAAGMRSHIAVPLIAHGKVLGALGLTTAESGRRFSADDVVLAEEVAVRAALTIERARLYQEMKSARAEAEAASRSKDVFLAMLGHELRNPLAPIMTALQLMRMRGTDVALKERSIIERQVEHLVRLVDDLLDVSRITRGKLDLDKHRLEISDVIAKAIEMSGSLLEQQRHQLDVRVLSAGLCVDGDHARLAQVFCNLLSNAAKYTRPGGRIGITAGREGDLIIVRVEDNGEGIDAQLLPRVFDLFEQSERTIDRAQGGLGIGLTIVKTLVELHGGTITARSNGKGQGSEFEVRLPASATKRTEHSSNASEPTSPTAKRRALRVLLVDDNQDAVSLLAEALETLGYETRVAYDGPSGIAAAADFAPAVALLDIGLPVMDGYELAQRLRAHAPGIYLVAMTGYGQEADRRRTQQVGFLHHLVKPVSFDQVARILEGFERGR